MVIKRSCKGKLTKMVITSAEVKVVNEAMDEGNCMAEFVENLCELMKIKYDFSSRILINYKYKPKYFSIIESGDLIAEYNDIISNGVSITIL